MVYTAVSLCPGKKTSEIRALPVCVGAMWGKNDTSKSVVRVVLKVKLAGMNL